MKTQKLLDIEYYIEKISLSMQNDHIFMQQIEDLVAYLNTFDNTINTLMSALQEMLYDIIFNPSAQITKYKYTDLLEKIASIFNISRSFIIDFKNPLTNEVDVTMKNAFDTFNENYADDTLSTNITLTDNQMRLLIYCAIMKNSYDGSYEMLDKVYRIVCKFMSAEIESASSWQIIQLSRYTKVNNDYISNPACADCIFAFNDYIFDEDDKTSQYFTLFFAGLLTIQSAGIYYYYAAGDLASVLYWADISGMPSDNQKWSDSNAIRRWL